MFTINEKLSNLRENKTFMACLFLTVLSVLGGYFKWFEVLVSISAIIFMIVLPIQSSFCIYMFLHNFTLSNIGYESLLILTTFGFCFIMLYKYLRGVKNGTYKYHHNVVVSMLLFVIISIALSLFKSLYVGAWVYLAYLPLFYLFFTMRNEFDVHQAIIYMFAGTIVSAGLGLICKFLPEYQYNFYLDGRYMGFMNHPNSLYIRAIFALTYFMHRLISNKMNPLNFLLIYAVCAIITLSTGSKMGIFLLGVFTIITIVLYLKSDFKTRIKHVGIFALIVGILSVVCFEFIVNVINRFIPSNGSEMINSVTTGRDDIWRDYWNACIKNPFTFLFGNGFLTHEVYIHAQGQIRASHSLYLFLLYRFGIVGICAIGYIIYLCLKILNKEKPKFSNWLPLIMLLFVSISANTFKSYNFTYFILALQILFVNSCPKPNKEEKSPKTKSIKQKQE